MVPKHRAKDLDLDEIGIVEARHHAPDLGITTVVFSASLNQYVAKKKATTCSFWFLERHMPNFLSDGTFWIVIFPLFISLVVCLGGLYALLKQKVIVNESNEVTSIELPLIGKIKTNYPSLVALFLGVSLAAFVLDKYLIPQEPHQDMPLVATINIIDSESSKNNKVPRTVYVGAIPMKYHRFTNEVLPDTPTELTLHVADSDLYHAFAYTATKIHPNGHTEHAVDHGTVEIHNDTQSGRRGTFSANLRIE